ncbi:MAG: sensor histidine kinase [Candidatus Kariarchaeaceae archaeon]
MSNLITKTLDHVLKLNTKTRYLIAFVVFILSAILTIIFREASSILGPASWSIVSLNLVLNAFLLNKKEGALVGLIIGVNATITVTSQRNDLKQLLFHFEQSDFWFLMLVLNFILFITVVQGYLLGSLRELMIEKNETGKNRAHFISVVTHELRNQLAIATSFCSLLFSEETDTQEEKEKQINYVNASLYKIDYLTNDLSILGSIERGQLRLSIEKVEIINYLKDFIEPYKANYKDQITFISVITTKENAIDVMIDKVRIDQVLINILKNAINNTDEEKRKISIKVDATEEKVTISVKDNGVGINPKNVNKIFDKFYSCPSRFNTKSTGIGLYLAKSLIESHNGKITVFSGGEEKGAVFYIELPRENTKQ